VDLAAQTVVTPAERSIPFQIDQALKQRLLNGLDDIGMTLQHAADIRAYEQRRAAETPWLFPDAGSRV
jgi:3-isopropylmalate/(R)-2-methylmalate dehydratase small subunit